MHYGIRVTAIQKAEPPVENGEYGTGVRAPVV